MKRHIQQQLVGLYLAALLVPLVCTVAQTQATAFTYQGKFADSGTPATGNYDFEFKLFNTAALGTGAQVGSTVQRLNVSVANGIFTVSLDFGACASCFNGADRFLEISVKPTVSGAFVTLGPRQPITSTPYALKSVNATTSDGLSVTCVSCVTSSQIGSVNGSAVSGAIPVASVPSGSANYIQNNPASQQATSNFNIANGTVGGTLSATIVNATMANAMQYYMNGSRVLSNAGSNNLFAGVNAGAANTGSGNSFFGRNAGQANQTGSFNAFFGGDAGIANTDGENNSFVGAFAGFTNSTGVRNSFFGAGSGNDNSTGSQNSFFGRIAGNTNTTGSNNSFFGDTAGNGNTTGSNNTIIGFNAHVGANNLTNAAAIGANARVNQINSIVLGGITGINSGTSVNVGIGLTAPKTRLDVVSSEAQIRFGNDSADSGGYLVSTVPSQAALAGGAKWDGDDFVAKSTESSVINMFNGAIRFSNNTGLTPGATFSATERMRIASDGNVGIATNNPLDKLHVNGSIRVATLGAANTTTTLCRNSDNQIATCNSSSLRYKTEIAPFISGLEVVNRLRPISFTWKQGGARDVGFAAEEVAKVEPLLSFTNEKGEIEGVKYDRISVVLVNAIKELKAENDVLKQTLQRQEERLRHLEAVLSQPPAKH